MKLYPLAILAAIVLLPPRDGNAAFGSDQVGISGAQFLSLGIGGRALGMGEAMTSVSDGVNSLYWNPAGLASLSDRRASFTHTQLFSDFYHDSLSYGQPIFSLKGTLAASLTMVNETGITAVTNTGQSLPGAFHPYSAALSFGYARKTENWQAGAALKGIKENLYDVSAYAAALDAGVIYSPNQRARLGFAFKNWGTKENFVNQSFSLPFEFDVGGSYRWKSLLLASDLSLPYYGRTNAKFGLEYQAPMSQKLGYALRLGYKTLAVSDLNALSGLTVGTGLEFGRLSFDFGFEPMQSLGQVYRFSLGTRF